MFGKAMLGPYGDLVWATPGVARCCDAEIVEATMQCIVLHTNESQKGTLSRKPSLQVLINPLDICHPLVQVRTPQQGERVHCTDLLIATRCEISVWKDSSVSLKFRRDLKRLGNRACTASIAAVKIATVGLRAQTLVVFVFSRGA